MRTIVFSTGPRYAVLLLLVADLAGGAPPLYAQAQTAAQSKSPENLIHVNEHDIPWPGDSSRSSSMRWRTLLGTGGYFGQALPNEDLYFRQGEMEPGAVYTDHSHPSPEAWFFISGRAKWKVDGETFIAEPGSAVYLKPNAVSSVEIISKDKADIVRINWGVNCDRTVLTDKKYIFLSPYFPRGDIFQRHSRTGGSMSNEIIVHKGRTNVVTVDMGVDVSADTLTSQIRSEPNQGAPLIADWVVSFATDGTDGKVILTLDDVITGQIKATSGFMDIKRVVGGEAFAAWDVPLEVAFRGTVTV